MKFVKQILDYFVFQMVLIVLINLHAQIIYQIFHVKQEELMEFVHLIQFLLY